MNFEIFFYSPDTVKIKTMDLSNINNKKQKMEDKEEESEVRKFVVKWSGKEFDVEVDAEV